MSKQLSFKDFSTAVEKKFYELANDPNGILVTLKLDKEELYQKYLGAYPEEQRQIFRERAHYDCNCCKNFIRRLGNVVAILDGKLVSIWDVTVPGYFQDVADAVKEFVLTNPVIDNFYLSSETTAGSLANVDNYDPNLKWDHFYAKVPAVYVKADCTSELGNVRAQYGVLSRSVQEISMEACEIAKELIAGGLYRGNEYEHSVDKLIAIKKEYDSKQDALSKDLVIWKYAKKLGEGAKIKNTLIGKLMVDISEGMEPEAAADSFEKLAAPQNYKRTSSIVTPAMFKKFADRVKELGYDASIQRRSANESDISIENVLFSATKLKALDVLEQIGEQVDASVTKEFKRVDKITLDKFISDVLPTCKTVEIMFNPKLKNNLMTLTAPTYTSSPNMFKWDNAIAWSYAGDVADSITERVKNAGGNIDARLRFSLAWYNSDDLDIYLRMPGSTSEVFYGNKRNGYCHLDVDANSPSSVKNDINPVENIAFNEFENLPDGQYVVSVHQYQQRKNERFGFTLQVYIDGKITNLTYDKLVKGRIENVVTVTKKGSSVEITHIHKDMKSDQSKEQFNGITTNEFVHVKMALNSPNYWGNNSVGNKHVFFILEGLKFEDSVRGFYNEYLKSELNDDRKSFEMVGNKLKFQATDDQLTGVGFSLTKDDKFIVRCKGSMQRIYEVSVM